MKRFVCLLCVLCLLPVLAVCDDYDYDYVVTIIDIMMESYGCLDMPDNYYTTQNDDGTENRHFFLSDDLKIIIETDGKKVYRISAACFHNNNLRDFFVACLAELTAFNISYDSASSALFSGYLFSESGESMPTSYENGWYSDMTYYPEKEMLMFFLMKPGV